jgi:uncharacterized protein YciI
MTGEDEAGAEPVAGPESGTRWLERYVLLYESPPDARKRTPEVFPAHSAYAAAFRARRPGCLLMIGPFAEPEEGQPGAMSIWTSREAAEEFAPSDPFVTEGLVTGWSIRHWLVTPNG